MSPFVKPFNEAKYKVLMDGLDASEIFISKVKEENPYFRIDSGFFGKYVIKALNLLKKHSCIYFSPKSVVNGPFGSTITSDLHRDNGYMPLVRSLNINSGFFINKTNLIYISKEDNDMIKHSQLSKDDIVLSRVGSIGFFARVDSGLGTCNISSNNIGIKLDGYAESEKHYIVTYLNTSLAKTLTNRRVSGNVQPKLTVSEIYCIPIPTFNERFYKSISSLILSAEQMRKDSADSYEVAVSILLSAIGTSDSAPYQQAVSVKLFSESCGLSGRLDAEYYQPKYTSYTGALKTIDTVQNACDLNDKNYTPDENVEYEYIELANVGDTGNISNVEKILGKDLPSRARRQVKTGQVIVASVEGSLQSCALITEEYNNALCSTGFYVLDSDVLNSETLLVLFKSEPIQALLKQRCSGTILTAITKDELLSMPLPQIDVTLQREIAIKVQESFAQRHKEELLLECAKGAVEMAIEQGEETAIKWLKEKGVEC